MIEEACVLRNMKVMRTNERGALDFIVIYIQYLNKNDKYRAET